MSEKIEYEVAILGKTKKGKDPEIELHRVNGFKITPHFAVREEKISWAIKMGWRITHLPSGHLLVACYFKEYSDAYKFAAGIEKVFGPYLDDKTHDALLHAKSQIKGGEVLYKIIQEFNRINMKDVTIQDVTSTFEKYKSEYQELINGQPKSV